MQNIDIEQLRFFCRTACNRATKDLLNVCLHFDVGIQHCLDHQGNARHRYPTPEQMQRVIHFFAASSNPHPKTIFQYTETMDLHTLATTIRDAMLSVVNDLMYADNPLAVKKRKNVIHSVLKNLTDPPLWEAKKGLFAPRKSITRSDLQKMVKSHTLISLKEINVRTPRKKYVDPAAIRAHREAVREKKHQEDLKNIENDIRKNFGV